MNSVENGILNAPARYGQQAGSEDQRQDWHDARARHNRTLARRDLLEIVGEIGDQLLGARRLGAEPSEIGAALLDAIDAHLDRVADWAVDREESTRPTPEVAARVALLRASITRASADANEGRKV